MSTGTYALTTLTLEHAKREIQGKAVTPEDSGAAGKARENSGVRKAKRNTGTRKQAPEQGITGGGNSGAKERRSKSAELLAGKHSAEASWSGKTARQRGFLP